MKVDKITVSAIMRCSKNYSFTENYVSLSANIGDDDPCEAHEALTNMVEGMLLKDMNQSVSNMGKLLDK